MKKHLLLFSILFFTGICFNNNLFGQGIPELLYYKFNGTGSTIPNLASNPPSGAGTATIYGSLTQGDTGTCGGTALRGDSLSVRTNYIATNWTPNLAGSWTISFWSKRTGGAYSGTPYYLFGDSSASAFRCFTKGAAGTDNWILRGPFTDVLATGGASNAPNVTTFVYNATAGYIYAYVNGKLVNSVAQSAITISGTTGFKLGAYGTVGTNTGIQRKGLLDEFRFYTRALSAKEVARLLYYGSTSATINQLACGTTSYKSPSGKYTWTSPGTYTDTILNYGYCDSFMIIKLTFGSNTYGTINPVACDFFVSPSKNVAWTVTGKYTDIIKNKIGCDSIIAVNLTIKNSTSSTLNLKECGSYNSPSGKYTWTTPGQYFDTIPNKKGCDSLITINLSIGKANSRSLTVKECDKYKSPSGKYTWTVSGSYKDTIMNKSGCDSALTINLTLSKTTTNSISVKVCNKYISPGGKTNWNITGTFLDTIMNRSGCDSIITVNLTLNKTSYNQITPVACGKYISPSGRYSYTVSNSFFDTIPNKAGCDSVILIEVIVNSKSSSTISRTVCKRYFSPSGRKIWTVSGKYYDTIPNRRGCDSIITVNLTVNQVDVGVTQKGAKLTATAIGAFYQWLNCNNNFAAIPSATNQLFTATALGKYAVKITEGQCSDTSICYTVTNLQVDKNHLNNYLSVYPNPATGQFTINSGKPLNNAVLKVINTMGEIVIEKTGMSGSSFILDISGNANGIYFIEITEKENSGRIKLIKY